MIISRKIYYIFFLLPAILGCKCRIAKNQTMPKAYWSIKSSNENNAFYHQYIPVVPYLEIENKKYYIKEAWIERSHLENNFSDELLNYYCFVMNVYSESPVQIDLYNYVKEMGNGSNRIWFNLLKNEENKDTMIIYYKQTLDTKKKEKRFLLIKLK